MGRLQSGRAVKRRAMGGREGMILMRSKMRNIRKVAAFLVALWFCPAMAFAAAEADRVKEAGEGVKKSLKISAEISPDLCGRGGMRGGSSVGEEGRIWRGRQLWTRGDGMPDRTTLYGSMGSAGSVRAGRREHRLAARWSGDRLCFAGYESQGRAFAINQQGEVGCGRFRRCRSQRAYCRERD